MDSYIKRRKQKMNFIIEYWYIIVALLALVSVIGTGVFYLSNNLIANN